MTSELDPLVSGSNVVQERIRVLTHEGFGMVAGDVVPGYSVTVDVVEESQTGLLAAVDVLLRIVWLGDLEMAGGGPGLVGPGGRGGVGRRDLLVGSGPEPPVDIHWLEVLSVAALEVAEPARGPDVVEIV